MTEIELKFQVPISQHVNVSQAFDSQTQQTCELYSQYYDTPDRKLAAAELELSLSLKENQWIQTLKYVGASQYNPLEHVVSLAESNIPIVNVDLHQGTAVGQLFFDVLGKKDALILQFETDILRTFQIFEEKHSKIKVSLDIGEIRTEQQHISIYELVFERQAGSMGGLFAFVQAWIERYDLWLDVSRHVTRGDQLSQGLNTLPVIQASQVTFKKKQSTECALRLMVANCLQQIFPNLRDVIDETAEIEHLHQIRIGIRRLRSTLNVFGHWSKHVNPAWEPALKVLFNQLGSVRDRDALEETLLPKLRAAGAPYVELPVHAAGDHAAMLALSHPSCNQLWIGLIAFAQSPAQGKSQLKAGGDLTELARKEIKHLHRQLLKDTEIDFNVQEFLWHRTRKRLKRLRYCTEFISGLYEPKSVQRYLNALRPVQDILGQYNDAVIAEQLFKQQAQQHPEAWFVLGWLLPYRMQLLAESVAALRKLQHVKRFW
ncbi:CHAD domain-containing protein [Acinetobacter sp. MB5]|uniref:CYTH and CHAD domain-containing protein n=1 Tax=Acinetobacter sp. MB5 TaxID=2069438 RepID=UPI000DCFF146|nr:CHAD domain-containing protein [Acinetobacter sp. MB5]